jgi:hypothetical protein
MESVQKAIDDAVAAGDLETANSLASKLTTLETFVNEY